MKVAVETNWLYIMRRGCARYVRGLLTGLEELKAPDLEYFPLAWPVENYSHGQPLRAIKTAYRELVWAHWHAPRILREQKADLVHLTGHILAYLRSPKRVYTLYDLDIIHHPERFRPWSRHRLQRHLPTITNADAIICISRFTADEAVRLLGVPASKLHVIYPSGHFTLETALREEEPPPQPLPPAFFVFVGALEPGKNLALLRRAYEQAASHGIDLPALVIVGGREPGLADEGKPPPNWLYLGHISDQQLYYLYRRALALVFPSRYEGFGLPLVEAMTLGCPVLCSPVASLPEVGGDAALFVEQTEEAYLDAMRRLASDKELRRELSERGYRQAKQFSWLRCAAETVAVYRKTLRS
jgi:glycosyltransferase involved in cell wall biosynthesis